MKFLKKGFTALLFGIFVMGLTFNLSAQDGRGKVVKTYNNALKLAKAEEYNQAITKYTEAMSQAEELGTDGQDIVKRVKAKLPSIYYQAALQDYKAFQKDKSLEALNTTISTFEEAEKQANNYGDSKIEEKSNGVVTQLMYSKAVFQYQKGNNDASVATLDEVISRNPDYAKAYYQKGIVAKNKSASNLDKALGFFDKAIEVGKKTNDNQIVRKAGESARDQLVYRGSQATENGNFSQAKSMLKRALEYDSKSEKAYYRLAEAYNKTQDFQQALTYAQKALELENGGRTAKAQIYFEMATAYQGLGKNKDACNAYEDASYGSFKSSAEHQMEFILKCDSTTK